MNRHYLATLHAAAIYALCSGGCVITPAEDDGASGTDSGDSAPTGTPSSGSATTAATATASSTAGSSGDTDATSGSSTTGPPGDCSANLVVDPGFENGTPNSAWAESSDIFGTPICDVSCTEDSGAAPHGGTWWVWFGGIEEPDNAAVSQAISIPPDAAYLSFFFEINAAQGDVGNDVFIVEIDGTEVFMASDAEIDSYAAYSEVQIEISQFADGGPHTLTVRADISGVGLTNFFVDDISLVSCGEDGGSSSGTGDPTGSTTATTGASTGTTNGSTGTTDGTTGSGTTDGTTGTGTTDGTTGSTGSP